MRWVGEKYRYVGKLGNYTLFAIDKSHSQECPYRLIGFLPGFNPNLGDFETEVLAKECADALLNSWLINTGLCFRKDKR